jgi:hypothetical protein
MESTDARLARMEEVQNGMNEKISTNHRELLGVVKAIARDTKENERDILILKRDRFWLFTICGTALSAAAWAVLSFFGLK